MTDDFKLAPSVIRDINFEVVADHGRSCEASLECADYLKRLGFKEDAESARTLRHRATVLSEIAFRLAAETPRVPA